MIARWWESSRGLEMRKESKVEVRRYARFIFYVKDWEGGVNQPRQPPQKCHESWLRLMKATTYLSYPARTYQYFPEHSLRLSIDRLSRLLHHKIQPRLHPHHRTMFLCRLTSILYTQACICSHTTIPNAYHLHQRVEHKSRMKPSQLHLPKGKPSNNPLRLPIALIQPTHSLIHLCHPYQKH